MDVIIIGAGLAGTTAALHLKKAGLRVLVVEARGRVGGRGYSKAFAGTGDILDFGGSWITPWQHRIRDLCARYGVALRSRHPVTARRWFYGGSLHFDGPAPAVEGAAHERALVQLAGDASFYAAGKKSDLAHVSFAQYLNEIEAPPATRELLSAWWTVSGNGDKTRVPATEFLSSVSHGGGAPDGICNVWAYTLEGGVQSLCERIIAAEHINLRFAADAHTIAHTKATVSVTLSSGEVLRARSAVVATGLNPMHHIAFDPPLSGIRDDGRKLGHNGRAVKIWAKLAGVPAGILATGGGRGIEWMFTERLAQDGATLAAGFGVADHDWHPDFPRDAEEAVSRFFPEARLLACDWHDWNGDPYARGAWVSGILGNGAVHESRTWAMDGPLAFASSDIASFDAGWFDAAVISGEEAAAAVAMDLKSRN